MLCSEQSCVDDGQLLSGVYSNHVQRVLPFTTDLKKKKKKKLEWADVAVVLKTTILLLVTYLVSLNCPITFRIIDQTLANFQDSCCSTCE